MDLDVYNELNHASNLPCSPPFSACNSADPSPNNIPLYPEMAYASLPHPPYHNSPLTTFTPPPAPASDINPLNHCLSDGEFHRSDAPPHNRHTLTSPPSSESASDSHGSHQGLNPRRHPTTTTTLQKSTRKRGDSKDQADGIDKETAGDSRSHAQRRRFEADQRRRDELRDIYGSLKAALQISDRKCSQAALIGHAVVHIHKLQASRTDLLGRLTKMESELTVLRDINQELMRNMAELHRTVMAAATSASSPRAQSY